MERRFYHDDFEDLIKQKADQYKMYPQDRVWRGIQRTLHPRNKWYWFGFAILLSGVGYYSLNNLLIPSGSSAIALERAEKSEETPVKQPAQLIPFKQPFVRPSKNSSLSAEPLSVSPDNISDEKLADTDNNIEVAPVISIRTEANAIAGYVKPNSPSEIPAAHSQELPDFLESMLRSIGDEIIIDEAAPTFEKHFGNIDGLDEGSDDQPAKGMNWLHEMAAFEFAVPKVQKLNWQIYFAPTMNYRKLTGSRNAYMPSEVKVIPVALRIPGDLDGLVNHKPALGFELGTSLSYALNKSFSLRTGIQFNYSRYAIEAYSAPSEIATIALNNQSGFNSSIVNYSNIRNFGGDAVKDIQNQYFQLSAPVGLEWRMLGNGKFQINLAGTLQPTYLLNRNTYLITTDYQNYTKEPSLVRRWNLNSSAEAYLSYNTGAVRWQVGPQFRYQVLSSYVKEYPISEHLMEYGIKFGVTKTIR